MEDTFMARAGQVLARGLLLIQGIGIATWVLVTVLLGTHPATVWLQVAVAVALSAGLLTTVVRLGQGTARARRQAQVALVALLAVQLVGAALTGPASVPAHQWVWPALNALTLLVLAQPGRRPQASSEPVPLAVDA